jgi:hypothetical protein
LATSFGGSKEVWSKQVEKLDSEEVASVLRTMNEKEEKPISKVWRAYISGSI